MDQQPQSRAPLIVAIVLLLLPLLYVGSYLAIVQPGGTLIVTKSVIRGNTIRTGTREHYLLGGRVAATLFLPLEQIDRKVRPNAWVILR